MNGQDKGNSASFCFNGHINIVWIICPNPKDIRLMIFFEKNCPKKDDLLCLGKKTGILRSILNVVSFA